MADRNALGVRGEEYAREYLKAQRYVIREANWRWKEKEIDIIAQKGDVLVIVEVKTRSSLDYGRPEDAVDDRKIRFLTAAANAYIRRCHLNLSVRFDILSLVKNGDGFDLNHIKDAFFIPVSY
ncbi:MAG: YraN family protein [Paludibacteraceae bacterium]|nr:YraN family protein [Paludibacteraceae bacterium]